jgi:nitrous oxide reductase accessory protein NosL
VKTLILCALLLVAACHKQRPPAPTPEQSSQLNEADSMLNNLANEEGPEANGRPSK